MNTAVVHLFISKALKHVLVPNSAHDFIVDMQPSFPTTTAPILVEYVNRIVLTVCGVAMMAQVSQISPKWVP